MKEYFLVELLQKTNRVSVQYFEPQQGEKMVEDDDVIVCERNDRPLIDLNVCDTNIVIDIVGFNYYTFNNCKVAYDQNTGSVSVQSIQGLDCTLILKSVYPVQME